MTEVTEVQLRFDAEGRELLKCGGCRCWRLNSEFALDRHGHRRVTCGNCKILRDAAYTRNKCEHGRQRSGCRECGGVGICIHDRRRRQCRECGGSSVCEHDRQRVSCRDCAPDGHLRKLVVTRIRQALKSSQTRGPLEYLGCPISVLKLHIEMQFTDGMTWENYGQWQMDHIVPIMFEDVKGIPPTLEEISKRLHWSNIQPLWRADNMAKGNRWVGGAQPTPAPAPPPAPVDIERLLSDADIDELLSGLGL